ncbi:MAG: MBL fold metallo-hydrolase [Victivallales bacterium]|nr:MBL fold metallo-hydrolase [Victivallales bacterium]
MKINLSFLGAAQNVTGSKYLLEANGKKLLIDCGMYQEHHLKDRNWEQCPVPADQIDAVLLTHAHLDHCGLLPRRVKEGFNGPVYSTEPTLEITRIVLLDCAKINEEDAQFKIKRHEKEGREGPHPVMPLYTSEEAEAVFPLFVSCEYNKPTPIGAGIEIEFFEVGHILGASSIRVHIKDGDEERQIIFSGDVGRWDMPILRDPALIGEADYIVCESTYGDRLHGAQKDIPAKLAEIINSTTERGGNIIIPSFAIERTQDILYYLAQLLKENAIPHLRIFVDSPMAVRVTDVFKKFPQLFDRETTQLLRSIRMPGLTMVRTTADSKSINHISGTAIIIAGAGMCTGGRIKHHLMKNLPRQQSTIMFVGYQATGTLGRQIIEGAERVRVLGEEIPVKAKITSLSGFSAHGDQNELVRWLRTCTTRPRHLFVTHGEKDAAFAFAEHVRNELGWETTVPEYQQKVELD